MKFAVISTTFDIKYSFFAPIVSMVWKNYIGYEPVVLFVDEPKNDKEQLVFDKTSEMAKICCKLKPIDGVKNSSIAQISRIFGYTLLGNDDDYTIISDADMIPISKNRFEMQQSFEHIHLWNPYSTVEEIQNNANSGIHFPMCYVGASVGIMKEIFGRYDNIDQCLLSTVLNPNINDWSHDEWFISQKIKAWNGFPSKCEFYKAIPNARVDRAEWYFDGNISRYIDCHAVRPGHTNYGWFVIGLLLRCLCNDQDFLWANKYRSEFIT